MNKKYRRATGLKLKNPKHRQYKISTVIFHFPRYCGSTRVGHMIKKQVEPSSLSPLLFSVLPWSHSFCNQREILVISQACSTDVKTVHFWIIIFFLIRTYLSLFKKNNMHFLTWDAISHLHMTPAVELCAPFARTSVELWKPSVPQPRR